jgi:hypothetical protein
MKDWEAEVPLAEACTECIPRLFVEALTNKTDDIGVAPLLALLGSLIVGLRTGTVRIGGASSAPTSSDSVRAMLLNADRR